MSVKFKYVGTQPIDASPGQTVAIYGHKFVWDGHEAIAEVDESYRSMIEHEIERGRPFKMMRAKRAAVSIKASKVNDA